MIMQAVHKAYMNFTPTPQRSTSIIICVPYTKIKGTLLLCEAPWLSLVVTHLRILVFQSCIEMLWSIEI